MANNLLKKLATLMMATTIAFTPIAAGCDNCSTPDNNNGPGIENVEPGNGTENPGNENPGNENPGNENPTPEQHSALLNAVLNNQYYKNAITAAAGVQDVANKNKYKPIPYKYLEDKGYNVTKIKNNELRCESDVFLYNNELYIALKTEVEASTNYFDCQILKYQITEQEIEELNKMYASLQSSYKGTYVQGPFMVQHISYLREPIELLDSPAKITPEAMKLCTTNISKKNYFNTKTSTSAIYLGCEFMDKYDYRFSFMIYDNYETSINPKNSAKRGIIEFSDAFSNSSNNIYTNDSFNVTQYIPDECKTAFEESIIDVKIFNSSNARLYDYNDNCAIYDKNQHI